MDDIKDITIVSILVVRFSDASNDYNKKGSDAETRTKEYILNLCSNKNIGHFGLGFVRIIVNDL